MTAPTAAESERERSVLFALLVDLSMLASYSVVGWLGGSLTIVAEAIRGGLMIAIDVYSLLVLRRVHRGEVAAFEFGAGKLEVTCNLAIAAGMLGGALWIAHGAATLILEGHSAASPLGLALAACLGAVNTFANVAAWAEVRAAERAGGSIIMRAQLQARTTKLVSSALVQASMTLAALAAEPVVAAWADATGALLVAGFIFTTALRMLRANLPDLLDRSVDEATRHAIAAALDRHGAEYGELRRLRSRRSGSVVFVEVALGFDPALPMTEVDRRIAAIRASIATAVAGADVSILALAQMPAPGG